MVVEQSVPVQRPDPARGGWVGRMRRAMLFGADRDTVIVALAGFLLRGGVVLLALPSVVLPSVIGLAGAAGVDAFAIDGRPTFWFFEMSAVVVVSIFLWLILAFCLGSVIDVWLIEAANSGEAHASSQPRPFPKPWVIFDMLLIRVFCVVPLAVALAWASGQIYTAVYNELTVPSDLSTPLPLRVVERTIGAVIILAIVWLATEVLGAVWVRRLVLFGTDIAGSLGDGLAQLALRPVSSAATILLSYSVSVVAMGGALLATATAFDWCRIAARNQAPMAVTVGLGSVSTTRDIRGLVFLLAAVALAIAWLAALTISGLASAWRSAAFTNEAADAAPDFETSGPEKGLGLSGWPRQTSED